MEAVLNNRGPGAAAAAASGYIVGPAYDRVFFIGAPVLALGLGLLGAGLDDRLPTIGGAPAIDFGLGVIVFAHLVIVLFRSHLNAGIFRRHPARFVLVPALLFIAMGVSTPVLVACGVLATFWDVYHSAMQTFGLGRIYDARAGNPPDLGRRLDLGLNLLLYAGPIAAGATLLDHLEDVADLEQVGLVLFTRVPALAASYADYLSWAVIAIGLPYVAYYLHAYRRLARQGYRVSSQKVTLLAATGICSVLAWGLNPFGMAFFIMNFFHAWQYFAIVWWAEKGNIARRFGFAGRAWAGAGALGILLGVGLGFGLVVEITPDDASAWAFSLFLVVSLMHFWYDGFVWSVRRRQL